jgi:hypothetical protein
MLLSVLAFVPVVARRLMTELAGRVAQDRDFGLCDVRRPPSVGSARP